MPLVDDACACRLFAKQRAARQSLATRRLSRALGPEEDRPRAGLNSPHESLAYIDAMGITRGMLIANTYLAHKNMNMSTEDILHINKNYSDVLSSHPHASNYGILCGVSFQRADAVEVAKGCLEIPNVRGIKVRGVTIHNAGDVGTFARLAEVADAHDAMILSHFGKIADATPPSSDDESDAMSDTKELVKIMDRLPYAKLLIAHSGISSFIGWSEYAWIGEHYKANPQIAKNIFIEASDSFFSADSFRVRPDADAWLASWRPFGIDRVVFGSDFAENLPWKTESLDYLQSTTVLSRAEAANVVRVTGERLFGSRAR
jgi:predicted TIM-barrel fold metal-dependent hydrolase